VSPRVLATAADWLDGPWGINIAYFLVQAGVVCLPCGRFPQNITVVQIKGYLYNNTVHMLFVDIRKAYGIGTIF
jgi:hypothetical protein